MAGWDSGTRVNLAKRSGKNDKNVRITTFKTWTSSKTNRKGHIFSAACSGEAEEKTLHLKKGNN